MPLKLMSMSKTLDKKGQEKSLNTKTVIVHTTYLLAFSLTLFWNIRNDLFPEKSSKTRSCPKQCGIKLLD